MKTSDSSGPSSAEVPAPAGPDVPKPPKDMSDEKLPVEIGRDRTPRGEVARKALMNGRLAEMGMEIVGGVALGVSKEKGTQYAQGIPCDLAPETKGREKGLVAPVVS